MKDKPSLPFLNEYSETLIELKRQIQEARLKAITFVTELMVIYWKIGKVISEREKQSAWVSRDLAYAFSDMKGFSPRNMRYMRYMRRFYEIYQDFTMLQQVVAKLPWGHNIILIDKLDSFEERIWYAKKIVENGWSRSMLTIWIENDLYNREGKAITNFKDTLPQTQSDLAQQATRDPYVFDFLTMDQDFREKELENGLIDHIQKLLMEFGRGFAFVGRQCPLEIDGREFQVGLLARFSGRQSARECRFLNH